MKLQFSNTGTIASYKRMKYEYAHALAEFIDNSTHAAKIRGTDLKKNNPNYKLKVDITYEPKGGLEGRGYLEVQDNACGMTKSVLENALVIGQPPKIVGRSRYGMGMKTAAVWMGNRITIRTKALGELKESEVILDLSKIAAGDFDLAFREIDKKDPSLCYTIIRVELLDQIPYGRAIGTIKKQLASIYRMDTRKDILSLFWNGEEIKWDDSEWVFLKAEDGQGVYKKDFSIEITRSDGVKKRASGWVGVLYIGGRIKAGFSTLSGDRVIEGYPEAWKPESIFGENASNNLVNQRLTGEIHFDDFDVSPTKDAFKWQLDEYGLICEELEKACADYVVKTDYEKRQGNKSNPASHQQKQEAVLDVKKEAESTVIADAIATKSDLVSPELVDKATTAAVNKVSQSREPVFSITFASNFIAQLFTHEGEVTGTYLQIATNTPGIVKILVNEAHPAFPGSGSMDALRSWYRMCLFDGIAEYQCQKMTGEIKPNTVRELKDILYRAYAQVE